MKHLLHPHRTRTTSWSPGDNRWKWAGRPTADSCSSTCTVPVKPSTHPTHPQHNNRCWIKRKHIHPGEPGAAHHSRLSGRLSGAAPAWRLWAGRSGPCCPPCPGPPRCGGGPCGRAGPAAALWWRAPWRSGTSWPTSGPPHTTSSRSGHKVGGRGRRGIQSSIGIGRMQMWLGFKWLILVVSSIYKEYYRYYIIIGSTAKYELYQ